MIDPEDLHRHFKVREVATGRDVWILGGDYRYEITDPNGIAWNYRASPGGDYFLARSAVHTHPWGRPMRLEEVEPLPDGTGRYHPDTLRTMTLQLAMSYEGSWRQSAGAPDEWGAAYAEQFPGVPLPRPAASQRSADPAGDDLKRERRRVVRCFQHYTSEQRADRASSHRLGHRQRTAVGHYYYTHPDVPNLAFPTRTAAARAALRRAAVAPTK
jgi:hypothetical protein